MTPITFQDGKVVFRDGKVGTDQSCCCCMCEPCGTQYEVQLTITGRAGETVSKTYLPDSVDFQEVFGDPNGPIGTRHGDFVFSCNSQTSIGVGYGEIEVEEFGTNQIYSFAANLFCGEVDGMTIGEWFLSISGTLEPQPRNGQFSTRFGFDFERLLLPDECNGGIPVLDTANMTPGSCTSELDGSTLSPCPVRVIIRIRKVS